MKQKLVFVEFNFKGSELIERYLSEGYKIVSMVPQNVYCAVTGDSYTAKEIKGELAVLLEKNETRN